MKLSTSPKRAFAVLIACIVLSAALSSPVAARPGGPATVTKKVCLSPGHGGADPGAINNQGTPALREVDLNWAIADRLDDLLTNGGYTFVYTHASASEDPSGTQRAEECNKANADTVLWIHLNSSTDYTVDYFKAFWGKKTKDEAFVRC